MQLVPIKESLEDNTEFLNNPLCSDSIPMTIDFYKRVGFLPPWIGYYVEENGALVGAAGFKGAPVRGSVEIAYGTFEQVQRKGIGTAICKLLVELALKTDPSIRITARTFERENYSTRILEKNNFRCVGIVSDPEDGEVWEWEFEKNADG